MIEKTTDYGFLIFVAQAATAAVVALGGWAFTRSIRQIDRLTEKLDSITDKMARVEREGIERDHKIQLEMTRVAERLGGLDKRIDEHESESAR